MGFKGFATKFFPYVFKSATSSVPQRVANLIGVEQKCRKSFGKLKKIRKTFRKELVSFETFKVAKFVREKTSGSVLFVAREWSLISSVLKSFLGNKLKVKQTILRKS